ncbi:hypothetical protein [Leifsonia sp. LS-T14]|uniref:WapI family immunity protein n=1 Tax=unclassified Leifsonia TaxID=2663824 RepID=UPI0035A6F4AF
MKLQDESGARAVELRPAGWHVDPGGARADGVDPGDARVVMAATVADDGRSWTLSDPFLTAAEVRDLAAWLAGLAEDTTAAADEWTALTFDSDVLSMSGHRIPGGTVELRIALLRMRGSGPGTTDVVVGLRAPQAAVTSAAGDLLRELAALR